MQIYIPDSLLAKYPEFTRNELRMIVRTILRYKNGKLRTDNVVNFTIPYLGKVKSHGNKKPKKYLAVDRRKKRRKQHRLELTPKKLLF